MTPNVGNTSCRRQLRMENILQNHIVTIVEKTSLENKKIGTIQYNRHYEKRYIFITVVECRQAQLQFGQAKRNILKQRGIFCSILASYVDNLETT